MFDAVEILVDDAVETWMRMRWRHAVKDAVEILGRDQVGLPADGLSWKGCWGSIGFAISARWLGGADGQADVDELGCSS